MRKLVFPVLLGIARALPAIASAEAGARAQALPAVASAKVGVSGFRVIFYPDAGQATSMESGTIKIERDAFRYSSTSGQYAWTIALGAIESIVVEPFAGPFRTVTSIVIESVENGRRVRRRIAAMDDVSLNERAMLTGMMRLRVERFRAARSGRQ